MLLVLLGMGCTSLINVYGECESDTECAQALGAGAVCLADGYCSLNSVVDTNDTDDTGDNNDTNETDDTNDTDDTTVIVDCTTHMECRGVNGWGSICNDDGTCSESEVSELPPRCVTYPSDAFDNPSTYSNAHIIGSIADSSLEMPAQLAIELAAQEINQGQEETQFVVFSCDNRSDLELTVYADNRDSLSATELVSSFLMNEVHVPVVIGPGITGMVDVAIDSSDGSDAVIISTAGGDGLTNLSSAGRVWSAVGDDRHRIVTMVDFINYAESYAFALILSDRHDLLDCATSLGITSTKDAR